MKNGHWIFDYQMGTPKYHGFLYLMVNKMTDRKYWGRKQFRKGGKKTSKTYGHQDAWRNYKSSSKIILEEIKENGIDSFEFYCIAEYENKLDLHYAEVKAIMASDAIIRKDYYNFHSAEIYVPPPCLPFRKRKKSINALLKRNKTDGKAV